MKCSCYKCGVEVPSGVENHFTSEDGRILCNECSVGVVPCEDRLKALLIEIEKKKYNSRKIIHERYFAL